MAAAALQPCPDAELFLALVDRSIGEGERQALEQHIDGCADCRALVAALLRDVGRDMDGAAAHRPAAPSTASAMASHGGGADGERLGRGVQLGRYIIVDWLGAGGMGAVYVAFDPQLDRKIALKILRRPVSDRAAKESASQSLIREAQAMARLQDPNVVTVYDVGAVDEQVYVAMEYVDGGTLRRWLAERPRSQAEILTIFRFAGKGLAAAHRASLVHRDFKPDNVLIATDGRVRVTDFGLARGPRAETNPTLESSPETSPTAPDEPEPVRSGVAGTPAYMAPEQLRGGKADARSDQFGFCVALHEALWGARPFAGRTIVELAASVRSGQLVVPPAAREAPRWLRQAVLRGLSLRPEDRWPSVDALLDALQAGTRRSRWAWIAGALAFVVAAGAAVAFNTRANTPADPCHGGRAALAGAWDATTKAAGAKAFHASGKPFADDTWGRVAAGLDSYAAEWATMRDESCTATRHGDQSAQLLDLRTACLDERLAELRAVATLLGQADAALVTRAANSTPTIAPLAHCADAKALLAVAPVPSPEVGAQVSAMYDRLAHIHALIYAGDEPGARKLAEPALAETRALKYRPLEARAALLLGQVDMLASHPKDAERDLLAAIVAGEAGRDDQMKAIAEISLAQTIRELDGRFTEADDWTHLALSTIERMGGDDTLEAQGETTLAATCFREGKTDEGLAHADRARQIIAGMHADTSVSSANLENTVALLLQRKGDLPGALAAAERARDAFVAAHGAHGRSLGSVEMNIGAMLTASGRPAEAVPHLEKARAILEEASGPENLITLNAIDDLAWAEGMIGEEEKALVLHHQVLEIEIRTMGPDHPQVGGTQVMIGDAYQGLGRYQEALAAYEDADRIAKKVGNDLGMEAGQLDAGMAESLTHLNRFREALEMTKRALAGETTDGSRAALLTAQADAYLGLHDGANALRAAEQANAIQTDDLIQTAQTRFALARALGAAHGDLARARDLATQARATWAGMTGQESSLDEVDAWLAAHK